MKTQIWLYDIYNKPYEQLKVYDHAVYMNKGQVVLITIGGKEQEMEVVEKVINLDKNTIFYYLRHKV